MTEMKSEKSSVLADSQIAEQQLTEAKRKLETALTFLRWLVDYTRGDWELRSKVVRCLMDMDEWDR